MSDFLNYHVLQHSLASALLFILTLLEVFGLKRGLMATKESKSAIILIHILTIFWLCLLVLPIHSASNYLYHKHAYIGNLFYLRCLSGSAILLSLWLLPTDFPYKKLTSLAILLGCLEGLGVYPFFLALFLLLYRHFYLTYKWQKAATQLEQQKEEIRKILLGLEEQQKEDIAFDLHSNLHDFMGQKLGAIQRLLQEERPDYRQIYPLINSFVNNISLAPLQDSEQTLTGLQQTYAAIDLNITLKGSLPKQETLALVFVQLIREAANNALRHGNATQLYIIITPSSKPEITITNNGITSPAPLKLGKGLQGLRKLLARANYTLTIEQLPQFTLIGRYNDEND